MTPVTHLPVASKNFQVVSNVFQVILEQLLGMSKSRYSVRFWILLLAGKGKVRGASPVKLPRRQFLHLAAGAAALPAIPRSAFALDYPTRPVRIVVGWPAGNSPDIVVRRWAMAL